MKIVEYRVTPIAFSDPPLRAAFGLHAPYALRTILEIVSDPSAASKMGKSGRSLVESRFTWPRVAEQSIAAYRTVLNAC